VVRETWGSRGKRVKDYTLYTGALGTAYLLFKAYQVTKDGNDLKLCSEIVEACHSASADSGYSLFLACKGIVSYDLATIKGWFKR